MKLMLLLLSLVVTIINPVFGELIPPYKTPLYGILSVVPQEVYPIYKDNALSIPRVDIEGQQGVGVFQDARFVFSEGNWKLFDFKIANATPRLFQPQVHTVTPIITDSFPVQVFLRVGGHYFEPCYDIPGLIRNPQLRALQRFVNDRFDVTIYQNGYQNGDDVNCDGKRYIYDRFEMIVPLSVYGLRAGTYQYSCVGSQNLNQNYNPSDSSTFYATPYFSYNIHVDGSFELKKDNLFPANDVWDPLDNG